MKSILTIALNPTFQKILVFNNYILDTVNRAAEHMLAVAGKGVNASRVLTQLGKKNIHLTQLGGSLRQFFLDLCALDQLQIEWVESGSQIRFCYTVINKNDRSVTELVEEGEKVEENTGRRLLDALDDLLSRTSDPVSMLVICGSRAAGFDDSIFGEMVRRAKAKDLPVILDIRGRDLLSCLPFEPDIIKPNLYEFVSTFAPDLVSGNETALGDSPEAVEISKKRIFEICNDLYRKYRTNIILSRGSESIWYFENGEPAVFDIETVEPVSSIGCGDAFTGGLAAVYNEGGSLRNAVAEGARCGKLNALQIRPGVIR